MDEQIETVSTALDAVIGFAVAYGFQILGAVVFLVAGLYAAGWVGRKIARLALARDLDETLARFIGNAVKLTLIVFLAIITLGNFGISVAPLIALAGAMAFGATFAIQGPLSNYGAGLSIIVSRPFVVGNTIAVQDVSGVVEEITLAHTVLIGEDGERITVPNRHIVGEVIVNSNEQRMAQTEIVVAADSDVARATDALTEALGAFPDIGQNPVPLVGVHDFAYGGIVLGLRFWVPSTRYYQTRYAVNRAALEALRAGGIELLPITGFVAPAIPRRGA